MFKNFLKISQVCNFSCQSSPKFADVPKFYSFFHWKPSNRNAGYLIRTSYYKCLHHFKITKGQGKLYLEIGGRISLKRVCFKVENSIQGFDFNTNIWQNPIIQTEGTVLINVLENYFKSLLKL